MTPLQLTLISLGLLFATVIKPTAAQTNYCSLASCDRETKSVNYGFGNAKEVVDVDVGTCTAVYDEKDGCTVPTDKTEECVDQCSPKDYNILTKSNRSGPFTVETIRSCIISDDHCDSCQRVSNDLYLFPDSNYQTTVDIGKCVGQCNVSSTGCVAVRNQSVAVEGPNGNVTVDTIQECGCRPSVCYRADYFVSYTQQTTSSLTGQTTRNERVINVGQCVGGCEGVIIPGRCYPSPEQCLLEFSPSQGVCVPLTSVTHTFTDINGVERRVNAIDECGCSTG